jgi:diacylglycerol O-acyltransferase
MSRLRPIERSFFSIETPSTLQTIACLCPLDSTPPIDLVRRDIAAAIEQMPRLKERLTYGRPPLRRFRWELDRDFNLNNHLHQVHLLGINTTEELYNRAADLFYRPFDLTHPLWRFIVITSSTSAEGAAALPALVLLAVHHGYADGLGGLEILNTVCAQESLRKSEKRSSAGNKPLTLVSKVVETTSNQEELETPGSTNESRAAAKINSSEAAKEEASVAAKFNRRTIRQKLLPIRTILEEARAKVVRSALNGKTSNHRVFNLIDLPLARLNPLKRRLDATVNDILLSLLAEAMRRYSAEVGAALPRAARLILPVSLRKRSERLELGNLISGVGVKLPLGTANQIEQVKEIRRQTVKIKTTDAGRTYALFAKIVAVLPSPLQRRFCEFQATKTAFICTNMNVSARPQFFAGARINGVYALAALMRRHGTAFACIRYTDKICIGMVSDPGIVANPQRFLELVSESLTSLEALDCDQNIKAAQ